MRGWKIVLKDKNTAKYFKRKAVALTAEDRFQEEVVFCCVYGTVF